MVHPNQTLLPGEWVSRILIEPCPTVDELAASCVNKSPLKFTLKGKGKTNLEKFVFTGKVLQIGSIKIESECPDDEYKPLQKGCWYTLIALRRKVKRKSSLVDGSFVVYKGILYPKKCVARLKIYQGNKLF